MGSTLIERLAVVSELPTDGRPFSVSPDGTTVAFEWRRGGDWQVYIVDSRGKGTPQRLVEIDDPCGAPKYSPDGRYLYFSRDDRGSECYDIYRYDLRSGSLENLLPDTPKLSISLDFDLSPDGTELTFSVQRGLAYAAAVMPAAANPGGLDIRFLTDHQDNDWAPDWSPDGGMVAFQTDTEGQDAVVTIADMTTGERRLVGGDSGTLAWEPRWSPDGSSIAFSGVSGDHYTIGVYDLERDTVRWIPNGETDCHHPVWSPDGRSLVWISERGGENVLLLRDLASGESRELALGRGNHYHPRFTPDGSAILVVFSAPGVPTDLFRVEVQDETVTRLTDGLPGDLGGREYADGEKVWFRSLDGLAQVPALSFAPRRHNGAGVVIIHGGPTWHHSNEWDPLREAFLEAGCMVVHPNYRGSDGYGRSWQLANRYLVGQGEIQDVAATHAFLVESGCDPARIACTGRSWGGFHTMALLTQYPELWACGVAGVPFFDFVFSQEDPLIRGDLVWWDQQNSGRLPQDKARLEYYSPINHLERIQAPVLIMAAALDPRCPPTQVDDVVRRIREGGVECEAVIYPDEGHEISGEEHRVDYDRRTVEFILGHISA